MSETPARIEPCEFADGIPGEITDLVDQLRSAVAPLGAHLHPDSAAELADLVRVMNCYYSNLIEGHNTRPKDIELALANAEIDPEHRPLAEEAKAHVLVERQIDELHLTGQLPSPTSLDFVTWVHRQFYQAMPAEFRFMTAPDKRRIEIIPGAMRSDPSQDNAVGRHIPPSSERVSEFMKYFETRFAAFETLSARYVIAIPIAHHRFNYIHPFPDGNGRVSRLMSHAMNLKAGLGAHGLWSISRGLARGLKDRGEYKIQMDHADMPRQGDRDGRGNLSENALREFCLWFLTIALDQVKFMTSMFDLDQLETRYIRLLKDLEMDERSEKLVSVVLRFGRLERGAAQQVLQTSERTARNVLSRLQARGFIRSATPKAPVRIAFPLDYRERLFPNLFAGAPLPNGNP